MLQKSQFEAKGKDKVRTYSTWGLQPKVMYLKVESSPRIFFVMAEKFKFKGSAL